MKLDKYSKHEFLDRTCIVASNFNDFVINHVNFDKLPKKLRKKYKKATMLLWELYQDSANL